METGFRTRYLLSRQREPGDRYTGWENPTTWRSLGKGIGRPRKNVDAERVAELRGLGWSWG